MFGEEVLTELAQDLTIFFHHTSQWQEMRKNTGKNQTKAKTVTKTFSTPTNLRVEVDPCVLTMWCRAYIKLLLV